MKSGDASKLKLERDGISWSRWGIFLVGVGVVLILATFGFLPVGSDAQSIKVRNPVGTDMTLDDSFMSGVGGGNESRKRTGREEYPSMTRYQLSSITPRRSRTIQFGQSQHLEFVDYTVKKGDNIWVIARRYGLSTYSIVSANYETLTSNDYLPVGMELRIPNRNGIMTELKKNQTLWDLMQTYGTDLSAVLEFNQIQSPSHIARGEKIFIPGATPVNPYKYQLFQGGGKKFSWPVSPGRRYVSSDYGKRNHPILDRVIQHRGIDVAAKFGTAVFASRAGIVEYARKNHGGYGIMVKIRHGNGYMTVYAHLNEDFVREGQYVQRGQRIGEIGESGMATGPNLHFEIRRNNKTLDPLKFLANS
jgi:murein DD-endopeptidase MepM/ murein hydrolase activator NlpD